ncbi:MAG: FAD-dependent oxidoreductase, partial [Syntrophothermus sp.]
PGGYERFFQIADHLKGFSPAASIDIQRLKALAEKALTDPHYKKGEGKQKSVKLKKPLPAFDCYTAPCTEACPAHQNIPGYIRLTEEGRYEEAFRLIMETNPLPNITGHICDHKCMTVCTRLDYDSSVEIREIKKEAALNGYSEYLSHTEMPGILPDAPKAAVIGAGPSGLSAAYYLRREGFDVTVYEKNERAGGTVQETIPDFRLPQKAISNDINLIEKTGVKFVFGIKEIFSIEKLKEEGYKYIYIGIGAMLPNEFDLKGNGKIFDALDFLKSFRTAPGETPGKIAAVIGGGNSAMDAARAALRLKGTEKVYIIYRRTKEFMPADLEEFENAVQEGAVFRELLLPEEFSGGVLRCRKMELSDYDHSGRRKVIPTEYFEDIKTDWVISAIGEHTDIDLLKDNKIIPIEDKYVKTDKAGNETRIENVYIGGDALRGPSTVIESAADGRMAAEAIAIKEFGYLKCIKTSDGTLSQELEERIVKKKAHIQTENVELKSCLSDQCLSCDLLCNKCVEVCPNRANVAVKSSHLPEGFRDKYQIIHLDAFCNECGNCATFCPYEGKPYKDKITLFLNEEDFNDSTNDGFTYGETVPEGKKIRYRIKDISGEVVVDRNGKIKNNVPAASEVIRLFNIIEGVNKNYGYLMSR